MVEIAITGIGRRLPGGGRSPEQFWELCTKGDGMVEVPSDRWSLERYYDYDADPDAPGRMHTRRGGFLVDPVCDFDPELLRG